MCELPIIGNTGSLKKIDKKPEKKALKKEKTEQETDSLSRQIEYLGAINRVNITAPDSIPQNISFKGSIEHNKNLKPLSDEEFECLKKKIEEKLKLQEYISPDVINKNNILLADKILSCEDLFNNPDFMRQAELILAHIYKPGQAEAKCNLLDKILSDKRLSNNPDFIKEITYIIYDTDEIEQAEAKCRVINKILSDERLVNNPDLMDAAKGIIYFTNTKEQVQVAEKILSNKSFSNNPSFMNRAKEILQSPKTPEQIQVAEKISSNEKLFNNPDFMKHANCIIRGVETQEHAQAKCNLIDRISSNEKILNNSILMDTIGRMLVFINTGGQIQLADKILSDERLYGNPDFMKMAAAMVKSTDSSETAQTKCDLIDNCLNNEEFDITSNLFIGSLIAKEAVSSDELKKLGETVSKDDADCLWDDTAIAAKFLPVYKKQDINEIPLTEKRNLLKNLVALNSNLFEEDENLHRLFPLLPKNQEEYCALLPSIVRSTGIKTNTLSDKEIESFNNSLNSLSSSLKNISDEEFNNLDIKQEYSKDDFISDTLGKVKNLTPKERQKVYDYFGFELHYNKENKTGFSITGYPVNLNNGKKLAQIADPKTKAVVEDLRKNVIHFSENNPVTCNNGQIETLLNEIIISLPELRPMIGRTQAKAHDFDCFLHSLKVMKEIVQDPEFDELNNSDKKIMLLASLLHDITKREGITDKTHENEGAFDSFFIAKKFNLTQEEEIKLYTLIKNHEWLQRVNRSKNEEELAGNIQSTAYDLRHDNIFDMSLMFTHADLKAVKKGGSFHDTKEGNSRIDFNGNIRSFGESADYYAEMIKKYISELQKSQPVLPATKLPSSDKIKSKIIKINADGSTNIKGVYEDKNGLIIIKYNEVENWEAIGLPEGSKSKGIKTVTDRGKNADTGNIKFIAHGLDYPNQLAKFDVFSLPDSNALLSVSYMERPESKYRLYRPQGVLLDVDTKYIHGGCESDSGSGNEKNIHKFIFGKLKEKDRLFISSLIKEAAGMNDEEYVEFVRENSNKSFNEIKPVELGEKLIKAFASINSNKRLGEREYNEMYISNPKITGVFAYNTDKKGIVGNPVDFLNSNEVSKRTNFLKQYAIEHNIPFVVFGN
ncbi:MAG: HD domain-containing protein [Candidatus Gastranaerophilales bacterium]|nr:HD domain-containing protein [Candidatus Gastranaerophilales bacterium]